MHDLTSPHSITKNHILNALPKEDYERLFPDFKEVKLTLGQVIYRPDEPIKHVYFPDDSMISVIATTPSGQCAEVGVAGREGAAGISV